MNFKIVLGGVSLAATSIAAYLSIPSPKPTRIDWSKVNERVKEDCGDGTRFNSKGSDLPKNDKGYTMKGYEECKKGIYDKP